jgi:hypothetical protein
LLVADGLTQTVFIVSILSRDFSRVQKGARSMKRKLSIVLAVLFCLSAVPSEASAKPRALSKKAIHALIKADLCKDWKPSKHSPNCIYSDKWITEISLNSDERVQYLLKPGFPWAMPGHVEEYEFRIYEIQNWNHLVRIFRDLGKNVSVIRDISVKEALPNLIVGGGTGINREWRFNGRTYYQVGQFQAKFDTPKKTSDDFKKSLQKRAQLRYKRANKPHWHKTIQKHCDQDCRANDRNCIICGC